MRIDYISHLITTTSSDSSIAISKYDEKGVEKIREIKNTHMQKEIQLLEISVYHNLMITSSYAPEILIWNYEFGKLVSKLHFEDDDDISAISFVNGYPLFLVATGLGYIYTV